MDKKFKVKVNCSSYYAVKLLNRMPSWLKLKAEHIAQGEVIVEGNITEEEIRKCINPYTSEVLEIEKH